MKLSLLILIALTSRCGGLPDGEPVEDPVATEVEDSGAVPDEDEANACRECRAGCEDGWKPCLAKADPEIEKREAHCKTIEDVEEADECYADVLEFGAEWEESCYQEDKACLDKCSETHGEQACHVAATRPEGWSEEDLVECCTCQKKCTTPWEKCRKDVNAGEKACIQECKRDEATSDPDDCYKPCNPDDDIDECDDGLSGCHLQCGEICAKQDCGIVLVYE